ncbi:ATP-binding cassette domain-containing protein [Enemella sp. A6]|uniref:ATP-binding cassette domain-containing protein n=1 Tax=Enemella sp. A6 TaxID=3440152 RepID=UPI003EB795AD
MTGVPGRPSFRENWRAMRVVVGIAWRVDRAALLVSLLELVLSIGRGLVPVLLGVVVAAAAGGHAVLLFGALGGLAVITGGAMLMTGIGSRYRLRSMAQVGLEVDRAAVLTVARLPYRHYLDDAEAMIGAVAAARGAAGQALNRMLNALRHAATPIVLVVSSAIVEPRLLLIAALGFVRLASNRYSERQVATAEEEEGRLLPALNTYLDMCTDFAAGMEIRSYAAQRFVSDRIDRLAGEARRAHDRALWRMKLVLALVDALYFLGAAVVLGWIVVDAVSGSVTLTVVTVAVSCVVGLHGAVWQLARSLGRLRTVFRGLVRIFRIEDRAERTNVEATGRQPDAAQPDEAIVAIDSASVRYPGAAEDALSEVTVRVSPGETLVLVGANGAGKTTLGLLLVGLLEADRGLVRRGDAGDGTTSSVVFQDYAQLEGPLADSVSSGLSMGDEQVVACLERAGARDVLGLVGAEVTRPVGAVFPDSIGLSGGQWQKVAVARCFARSDARLVVLDEHTSALDPLAEEELLDQYLAEARRTAADGGATVFITHRMALAAECDRILVIDGGRVVSDGTHVELMQRCGIYSGLYTKQAGGFAS